MEGDPNASLQETCSKCSCNNTRQVGDPRKHEGRYQIENDSCLSNSRNLTSNKCKPGINSGLRLPPCVNNRITVYTIFIIISQVVVTPVFSYTTYPDFFNIAQDKPIYVTPAGATCGYNLESELFCESQTSVGSVQVCFDSTCFDYCPYTSQVESNQVVDLIDDYVTNSMFGSCLERDFGDSISRPSDVSYAVNFKATSDASDCGLELTSNLNILFLLKSRWNITFSFYINHDVADAETGALFEMTASDSTIIFRLYLEGEQIKIRSGDVIITQPEWIVPRGAWHHMALSVYEESVSGDYPNGFRFVSMYLDGQLTGATDYGDHLLSGQLVRTIKIGQTASGAATFKGYLGDYNMIFRVLSNREVMERYTGSLPETRIQNECRCPAGYPMLMESDPLFCTRNPGNMDLNYASRYRIQDDAYPLQFINDGTIDRTWISHITQEEVKIEIDLEQIYEVRHVVITFYSPFPSVVIIERMNESSDWQHWQLYSDACEAKTGYPEEANLASADDVTCKQIVQPNTVLTYSGGELNFDLLAGRDQWINDQGLMIDDLQRFIRAKKLRVTLRGHPFVSFNEHKYHGLKEIKVNGTCACSGKGSSCSLASEPYQCECRADSYSDGQYCQSCSADTYQLVEQSAPYPAPCLSCGCNTEGTVDGATHCDPATGQCPCKPRVEGLQCDTCEAGYYNLEGSNPDGCTVCDCNLDGVANMDMPCDQTTGLCQCKPNVVGDRCDACEAGYFNLQADASEGCSPCACSEAGTDGDASICDIVDGQCNCKTHSAGRACDVCASGYYGLDPGNPDGCIECNCNFPTAQNTSCDLLTGACYCKEHVAGNECDTCEDGYYALSDADFEENGCVYECGCSTVGSRDLQCAQIGGDCACKGNTEGRTCDQCKEYSYDFGGSDNFGCISCDCNVDGTVNGNLSCGVVTGQCDCKSRVEGRPCDMCMADYFGLSGANDDGCDPCECNVLGTSGNGTCDGITGQCPCREAAGDVDGGGRQCNSYINEVIPTFGPESGGTLVSIVGGFLGDPSAVVVTLQTVGIDCPVDINGSDATQIACITQPLGAANENLKNQDLAIEVVLEDNTDLTPGVFVYMEDPVIQTVEPLRSIVSGGILLTVAGEFLDSVAFPYLEISMVYTPEIGDVEMTMFESLCQVEGPEKMLCPTPAITLPVEFASALARRRRATDTTHHLPNIHTERHVMQHGDRSKRQVVTETLDYQLNSERLQFYIGFQLDGVMRYRNMSDTQPQFGILNVYINPEFEEFDDEVTIYRPYWPYNDDQIDVKGNRLDYGAQEEDYIMRVGDKTCKNIDLTTNRIICVPPDTQPSKGVGGSKDGAPAVTIAVGNIVFVAGYLKYEHSFWDNEPFRYGVLFGVIGFIILLIVTIILCIICCRRRKREQDKKNGKLPNLDEFDHHMPYPEEQAAKKKNVINAYDQKNFHFPTLNTERKPDPVPRAMHTLPPPSSRPHNGVSSSSSYLNPMQRPAVLDVISPELKYRVEQVVLHDERIILGRLMHEGKLGNHHLGQLSDRYNASKTTVLVKRLTESGMVPREINNFLEDTCALKDTKDKNVRRLIGVIIEENTVMALWPHAENGSLKSFITNDENMLTVGELIDFAQQVASGMKALAERKVVHKDLATRNCVVTKELAVKVADSSLTRDKHPEDYWRGSGMKRSMPVRWMALESLEIDVFTTKGDVWSLGILLWELLTRGCMPYPEQKNSSIKSFLMCGNRMDRPDFCPEEMYALMLNCWDESPRERPTFSEVHEQIMQFLDAQNTRTNLRNRGRQQVPSSRRRGHNNYAMLYQ